MKHAILRASALLALATTLAACNSGSGGSSNSPNPPPPPPVTELPPNILFVIMDDVGTDQMTSMGYGGHEAPAMPSINAIAEAGVRFRNTWSMPECSPGRSTLLTGRYPLRNNVYQALGPNDLANSQLDPWEMTVPKVLKEAGYESGMFGKFHLAGPEHNEAGNGTPMQLGWDHFYGWTGGLPGSIDTTAGGVAPAGTYSCGFVPAEGEPGGANAGACYIPQGDGASCTEIAGVNEFGDSPGLQCLTQGGVLVPNASCEATPPAELVFNRENAHYVSPLVVNSEGEVEEATLLDTRARGFRSTIEVDAAIDWINSRGTDKPWMATISFSSPHTPLQHPPGHLLRSDIRESLTADCANPINQRRLADALIEALDTELARLLVETGIATEAEDGSLVYDPAASDTMVVVIGDNGSFGPTVKLPFDATRAKGSAYQTGVWVPLIVAGPLVEQPDRDVEHMVNTVDVFRLFADIGGVDVDEVVTREIDSVDMLPYLANPAQDAIRDINFTQGGLNIQANDGVNPPCVFTGSLCSHTPTAKNVCEDNGGVWWGPGADDPSVLKEVEHCWQVNEAIFLDTADPRPYEAKKMDMAATVYQAVRNEKYKLVRNWALDYDTVSGGPVGVETLEFYEIDQAVPTPKLDLAGRDLLASHLPLTDEEQANLDALKLALETILASQKACPGDGNGDGVVDATDIAEYTRISEEWGGSS
ncbi:MAG TPA: sulfatase-like hydrolase/transferase, partial [Gammaproteobacteria bacterium]|nr:sulfatase-like hydrolase/transferase [Gammaproteobacteria bacterium]